MSSILASMWVCMSVCLGKSFNSLCNSCFCRVKVKADFFWVVPYLEIECTYLYIILKYHRLRSILYLFAEKTKQTFFQIVSITAKTQSNSKTQISNS